MRHYVQLAALVAFIPVGVAADDVRLHGHTVVHFATAREGEQLYAIIGFHPSSEILLRPSLRSRRITNPDAPSHNWHIQLQWQGRQIHAVPLVYASTEQYSPDDRGSLFDYLTFRLLVVEQRGAEWFPFIQNDQPLLLRA